MEQGDAGPSGEAEAGRPGGAALLGTTAVQQATG